MEDVKLRLANEIAAKLSGAPDSAAKAELVEELSDNLYSRYLEMTGNGADPEAAFQSAMDDLGSTEELVDYLNSLDPGEPLPGPEPGPEAQGGASWTDIFQNIGEIVRDSVNAAMSAVDIDGIVKEAMAQAKGAAKQAKDAVNQAKATHRDWKTRLDEDGRFDYVSPDGNVEIHFNKDEDPENKGSAGGPRFRSEGEGWMESRPGGDYAFGGEIQRIDVEVGGDISIRVGDDGDSDVVIGGDVEELEVTRSQDGLLVIRQGRTASSGFFFSRGLSAADVELSLPRRRWELLKVGTVNGDVEIEGDDPVDTMIVKTVSGDVRGYVNRCVKLDASSTNGDVEWRGDADEAYLKTVNGDLDVEGHFGILRSSSTNGDVDVSGDCQADDVKCSVMSGDLRLETQVLPKSMELSSKYGDIRVRLPDEGPFSVQFSTTHGEFTSDFFQGHMSGRRNVLDYRGGQAAGGPVYHMQTTCGDLSLRRL